MRNEEGVWVVDQRALKELVVGYFKNLFTDENTPPLGAYFEGRFAALDDESRVAAWERVFEADINNALFNMGALKTLGIYGLPAGFFQKHWSTVKGGVIDFILGVFAGCTDVSGCNETLLVLIPKISNPISISQFRRISLYSVVYKTITKIITNRIKPLLPSLIGPNKCSFIPGRQINDNIIIAQEIFTR